jgi:hypothetical protein
MKRTYPIVALCVSVGALLVAACSGDAELFGSGNGTGAGGTGTTTSTTTATTTTTGVPTTTTSTGVTTTSSDTGGTTTTTDTGSGGSGGSSTGSCLHALCEYGLPLVPGCTDCVGAICAADPFCCATTWDYLCIDSALQACGLDCGAAQGDCEPQYQDAPGYLACEQGPATCSFGFDDTQYSCRQICRYFGGECVAAYNDAGGCERAEELGCNFVGYESAICVCSRGCGLGPACTDQQTCNGGSCY